MNFDDIPTEIVANIDTSEMENITAQISDRADFIREDGSFDPDVAERYYG